MTSGVERMSQQHLLTDVWKQSVNICLETTNYLNGRCLCFVSLLFFFFIIKSEFEAVLSHFVLHCNWSGSNTLKNHSISY